MGNVLLIKIKKDQKVEAIDAIEVTHEDDGGALVHHHKLDISNFSWYMNSSQMLDELRATVIESAEDLNEKMANMKPGASTGPNKLQYKLFSSVIDRLKRIYENASVDKVSYLVQDDRIISSGNEFPTMNWVGVPKDKG